MARYCNQCGTPLREGARFCDECGTPVGPGEGGAVATPGPPAPAPVPADAVPIAGGAPLLELRVSMIKHLLNPYVWGLFAVTILSLVAWLAFGLTPLVLLVSLIATVIGVLLWWLNWHADYLTIYPDRIVRHEGVLNRTETVNPLWRIQDVTTKTKWYGLGWVYLETAGEASDQGFGPIRNASRVRDIVYRLMRPSS